MYEKTFHSVLRNMTQEGEGQEKTRIGFADERNMQILVKNVLDLSQFLFQLAAAQSFQI